MLDNSEPKSAKGPKGQWPKGVSGNRSGRPRGSRNKATVTMEAVLEEGAEQLINKAMAMALEGDTAALRLCLERILPARRDRLLHLDLPPTGTAKDNSRAISTILIAIGEGEITPGEGEMMSNILAAQTEILVIEEIESRLEKVEKIVTPQEAPR